MNLPLMKTRGLTAPAPTRTAAYRTRLTLPKDADLLPRQTLALVDLDDLPVAQKPSEVTGWETMFKAGPNVLIQPRRRRRLE